MKPILMVLWAIAGAASAKVAIVVAPNNFFIGRFSLFRQ
jgi:hypothetical protein